MDRAADRVPGGAPLDDRQTPAGAASADKGAADACPAAVRKGPAPVRARRRGRLSALDVATYGLLAAVALIFGYVEALFPLPIPVPGIKLGLGNIVVLLALSAFGWKPGLAVMLVKVVASALLFGNPSVFLYSLAGGAASFAAMCAALRVRGLSIAGVSAVGGVFHMVGQAAVVAGVLAPYVALAYLPILLVAGLATGLLTGYVCRLVIRTVGRSSLFARQRKRLAMTGRAGGSRGPAACPCPPEPADEGSGSEQASARDACTRRG